MFIQQQQLYSAFLVKIFTFTDVWTAIYEYLSASVTAYLAREHTPLFQHDLSLAHLISIASSSVRGHPNLVQLLLSLPCLIYSTLSVWSTKMNVPQTHNESRPSIITLVSLFIISLYSSGKLLVLFQLHSLLIQFFHFLCFRMENIVF